MEQHDDNGVILPFRQDAAFYSRCAERYLDEDNIGAAVQYARRAYEMDPENEEYAITFAEVLNRMHRYEESAQVLLLLRPFDQLPIDAVFGLASDFMGMEEFAAAQQCAEYCLKNAGDTEYIERASEMLELLDDTEELEIQIGLSEGEDCKLLEGIRKAKSLVISERIYDAIKLLEGMKERYPASDILDMELATTLFTDKAYLEAEQVLFGIFKRNSRHIRAHLLLAVLYRAEGKLQEADEELSRVIIDPEASPEELGYAGVVFLEFDEIDRAVDALERLRTFLPYDKEMLYQLGYCYLRKEDRQKAEEVYRILRETDESDTVAAYYEEAIRTESTEDFLMHWSPNYEVPTSEFLERRERLQTVASGGDDAIREAWNSDPSFRRLLEWALFSLIVPYRKSIMQMLMIIQDHAAERLLRRYLMAYGQSDDDKQFAFSVLLSIEAKPPFALYSSGAWQYGAVAPLTVPDNLPRAYANVLASIGKAKERSEKAGDGISATLMDRLMESAMRIFLMYIHSLGGYYPKLLSTQEEAMAGAFIVLASGSVEVPEATEKKVCEWYGVSSRKLDNALQRIFEHLREQDS